MLQLALRSLHSQTLSKNEFEIIVVNNGSTDDTADVVLDLAQGQENMHCIHEATPGLHAGRHRGLKEAKGDVLVYADDDIKATPGWLSAIADNFSDPSVSMVGGNNFPDFQGPIPGWLEELWAQPAMGGQGIGYLSILSLPEGRREISPYFVWGCNFSIRKQVLLDAGGFHPDGVPSEMIKFRGDGETHVARHVLENGLRCQYDSRASVYHAVTKERMTFEYFQQRAFNQGVSDSYTELRVSAGRNSLSDLSVTARRWFGKMRRKFWSNQDENPELQELKKLVQRGYQAGFDYHQKMYREDPEVRAWVHKPNYF
ncbi:MAG: glycosyltransferase family 2 protein [Gammaproteobacteria bacterium]|nr:glycosyltransferase family 2 protein [Gammaproteobacteria bacterium]